MIEVSVSKNSDSDADLVYELLADFGNTSWMKGVAKTEVDGDGVGMVRNIYTTPDASPVREKLLARDDLARKVRWVSEEDGDGVGYDIASFGSDGLPRLIEVKTTNGWERTRFHITRNELAVAKERRSEWCLFRLWNFSRNPKAFELHPPLDAHVALTATTFQASFH